MDDSQAGPSLTAYASRFLANRMGDRGREVQGSQIFRSPSPSSPTHDPFIPSPSLNASHPHLPGSRSPSRSPTRTPPFPGAGIEAIPDIDGTMGASSVGVGLLFDGPEDDDQPKPQESFTQPPVGFGGNKGKERSRIPNPYESSSESEDEDEGEPEMALDEVDTVRRSLLRPHPQQQREPLSERAKKGWLAHQSVFPPSSSSSSDDESDKETESESGDGESRFTNGGQGLYEGGADSSNLYDTRTIPAAYNVATNLEEPLLAEEDGQRESRVPVRLHVYHGRFGHWEKEGLRKYKGQYIDSYKAWD